MSIAKLNESLLTNIALYASESAQDLAKIAQTNKAFRRAVCDKVHPILLATYAKEPSLRNEVAKDKQLSTLFQSIIQGVKNIGGGNEYLASLKRPACSLASSKLAELANWSTQQKAESLLKLFSRVVKQIPSARTFFDGLDGTDIQHADAIHTWLLTNGDLLNGVTEINLMYAALTILPDEIALYTNLRKLYLHVNRLQTVPESLSKLSQLQELDLSCNHLQTVPESLGNLSHLKGLALWDNHLHTVPASLSKLSLLKLLLLSDNHLQTVPASLGKLSLLNKLDLKDNPIQFVSKALKTSSVKAIRENKQIQNAEELQPTPPSCQTPEDIEQQPSPPSLCQEIREALYACWSWMVQQVTMLTSWLSAQLAGSSPEIK